MSDETQRTPRSIPWAGIVAGFTLVCGAALTVGGVLVLAGQGWAMLAAAVPFLVMSAVIFRGLSGK